jgi:glutamate carboxypeptidase
MSATALLEWLRPRCDDMLAALRAYVEHESPSRDKPALDALAGRIEARWKDLGGAVGRIANPLGGDFVRARFELGSAGAAAPGVVLGHFDTVWPLGTLRRMPFRIEDGRACGPGAFDMKASLVMFEFAIEAIQALGLTPPRPIVALFTSDEEIGSPASSPVIKSQAAGAAYALVPECPLPGGGLKTARKGVGGFTVRVRGRAAHAGVEPEKGASAIVELAHQVLEIVTLADPAAGTTLNVGLIEGGTASNVVAAEAMARVDVRAAAMSEARRVEERLKALRPRTPGTTIEVEGGFNRPPMERTPAIAALFERARDVARTLGQELTEGSTGGGSDGNFTAALGIPTLDGLGAPGGGAHADDEHVLIDALPERTALIAALLLGL